MAFDFRTKNFSNCIPLICGGDPKNWSVTFHNSRDIFDVKSSNEFSRATIHAGQTFNRLQKQGHSDEAARRMVAGVIDAEEAEVGKRNRPFDEAGFVERLRQLS